ncbi:unnamed protein product, partial [Microthlaspi erraticum]
LDRVEAWPVELRNSTGWSSRRSSWSSRWLLPSSFACQLSCFHVPRNQLHLLPTFDEYGAEEETNGAPNLFHKIRIFTPKDSELKGDQSIEEKLERTMKLFPKALVFKDDVRDDSWRTTPPQEATEPENGEAKGILCPSATLHHD